MTTASFGLNLHDRVTGPSKVMGSSVDKLVRKVKRVGSGPGFKNFGSKFASKLPKSAAKASGALRKLDQQMKRMDGRSVGIRVVAKGDRSGATMTKMIRSARGGLALWRRDVRRTKSVTMGSLTSMGRGFKRFGGVVGDSVGKIAVGALGKFTNVLKDTGKAFALVAIAGPGVLFASIAKLSIGMATFSERSVKAFGLLKSPGEGANALFERSAALAGDLGLGVKSTVKQIMKFRALQFTQGGAEKLIKMGADLRAIGASGEELSRIFLQLGQIKAKGRLQGEELTTLAESGVSTELVYKALGKRLGKTTKEVQKMIQAGKVGGDVALAAIGDAVLKKTNTKEFGQAGRLFATSTIDGFVGLAKSKMQLAMLDIGKSILPEVQSVVLNFGKAMGGVFGDGKSTVDSLTNSMKGFLGWVDDGIPSVAKFMKGFGSSFSFDRIGKSLSSMFSTSSPEEFGNKVAGITENLVVMTGSLAKIVFQIGKMAAGVAAFGNTGFGKVALGAAALGFGALKAASAIAPLSTAFSVRRGGKGGIASALGGGCCPGAGGKIGASKNQTQNLRTTPVRGNTIGPARGFLGSGKSSRLLGPGSGLAVVDTHGTSVPRLPAGRQPLMLGGSIAPGVGRTRKDVQSFRMQAATPGKRQGALGRGASRFGKFSKGRGGKAALAGLALGGVGMALGAAEGGTASKLLDVGGSALSGASTGALIGSIFPGLGTAIGAAVGGVAGAAYGLWTNFFKDESPALGQSSVDGIIVGMESKRGALMAQSSSLAMSQRDAYKSTLGIQSPSRVFARLGAFTGQGLALGMDRSRALVMRSSAGLAASAIVASQVGSLHVPSIAVPSATPAGIAVPAPAPVMASGGGGIGASDNRQFNFTNNSSPTVNSSGGVSAPDIADAVQGADRAAFIALFEELKDRAGV